MGDQREKRRRNIFIAVVAVSTIAAITAGLAGWVHGWAGDVLMVLPGYLVTGVAAADLAWRGRGEGWLDDSRLTQTGRRIQAALLVNIVVMLTVVMSISTQWVQGITALLLLAGQIMFSIGVTVVAFRNRDRMRLSPDSQ